jgi:hypothetical protein
LREDDVEKIAIDTDGAKPTHAARQLADGTWTSKLGQAEDICHQTLDALAGGLYGNVAQIMSRQVRALIYSSGRQAYVLCFAWQSTNISLTPVSVLKSCKRNLLNVEKATWFIS